MRKLLATLVNKEAIHYNQYYDPNIWLYVQILSKLDHSTNFIEYEKETSTHYQKDVQTLNCNLMYLEGQC